MRFFQTVGPIALGLAMAASLAGCGDPAEPPMPPAGPGVPGGPPPGPRGGSPLGQIMAKLGRGPNALTGAIGTALKSDSPAWDAIQGQAKEYVQLVSDMEKHDPPKGDKASWKKQVEGYLGIARELDAAAQAKKKDEAVAAHDRLGGTCMACHREHRVMGGPGGGFGGPPPGGPGGPPPGGPGGFGPPPGGPGGPPPGPGGPPPGGPAPK